MKRGTWVIHRYTKTTRPGDDVILPCRRGPCSLKHRSDDRCLGAEQGKGEQTKENMPPELLYWARTIPAARSFGSPPLKIHTKMPMPRAVPQIIRVVGRKTREQSATAIRKSRH